MIMGGFVCRKKRLAKDYDLESILGKFHERRKLKFRINHILDTFMCFAFHKNYVNMNFMEKFMLIGKFYESS